MADLDQRRIEDLRKGYAAFNRGDFERATRGVSADVEVKRVAEFGNLRGRDQMKSWFEPDAFESQHAEATRFEVQGDKVLVDVEMTSKGKESGLELKQTFFQLWTFEGETVVGLELYEDRSEAAAAAGIEASG